MKLRHVEVFHAIMLTGTVNGAARFLNVTQPAVTKVLLHSEDQLGFKLFTRHKGRITPTHEALTLLPEVERIFNGLETLRTLARNLRIGDAGRIRISAPPALCLDVIPTAISIFRKERPAVSFDIHSHHYSEAVGAVLKQDVDVAIVFNPQSHPALSIMPLAVADFVACFPAQRAADFPGEIGLDAFEGEAFIGLSTSDPLGSGVRAAFQVAGIDVSPAIEVKTNALALTLVEKRAGATIIDRYTAATASTAVVVRSLKPSITFEVGAITLQNSAGLNLTKRFLELVSIGAKAL